MKWLAPGDGYQLKLHEMLHLTQRHHKPAQMLITVSSFYYKWTSPTFG